MKLPAIVNEKLLTRAMLGVGVYFAIVKPLLIKFNIQDSKEEKAEKERILAAQLSTNSGSSASPYSWAAFFAAAPKDVKIMPMAATTSYAKKIHDSYNGWNWIKSFNDAEKVLGVLASLRTQSEFAWICKKFFEMYSTSMLEYLKQIFDEKGFAEFNLKLVQKPKYKVG
jgi:hypothetical protein